MRKFAPLAFGILGLVPVAAYAQLDPCVIPGLSCETNAAGYLQSTIAGPMLTAFTGILFAMLIFYGLRMLLFSHEENAITESRLAFFHALFGTIIVLGASFIADSFVTYGGIETQPVSSQVIFPVIVFMKSLVAILLVANISFQGIRLVTAQDEGQIEAARKRLIHGMIGAAIVILAGSVVDAVWFKQINTITSEVSGVANYIGTIFGMLAVIAVVVGGIMLVISVDDSMKERAKKIILGAVVTLAVVMSAWGLVTVFIF